VTIEVPEWAAETARALPYPLIFAGVSGAHLYGFASVDSDLDVRACHLLPAAEVLGLRAGPETLQSDGVRDRVELDVVSHDLVTPRDELGEHLSQLLVSAAVIESADGEVVAFAIKR